jgi:hypothetical protein
VYRYAGSIMSSFINVECCYAECHCVECCGTHFIVVVGMQLKLSLRVSTPLRKRENVIMQGNMHRFSAKTKRFFLELPRHHGIEHNDN